MVFALFLPALQLNGLGAALLQAGGNMRTPSALLVLMCGLDVLFNLLLIFPTRQVGGSPCRGQDWAWPVRRWARDWRRRSSRC